MPQEVQRQLFPLCQRSRSYNSNNSDFSNESHKLIVKSENLLVEGTKSSQKFEKIGTWGSSRVSLLDTAKGSEKELSIAELEALLKIKFENLQ